MKKEITIYDIAKELNLSASTVSRALKDNPLINYKTRKKVIDYAESIGYRENTFASNLRSQKTNTIGVIVPRLDSRFMSTCIAGIEEIANENGYNLIISQSKESALREEQNSTNMYNNRVDGLIVSLTIEDSSLDYFSRFKEKNVPIVFFDRVPEKTENTCVVIDNYAAAYKATKHLIDQGCRNLIHVTVKSTSNVYAQRVKGFIDASNNENDCKGKVHYIDSLTYESGKLFATELLKAKEKPDGIFFSNDIAAVACMQLLIEGGINIPNDISIMGFNDDLLANIISPKLSTIAYNGKEIGIMAAQEVIAQLKLESVTSICTRVEIRSELIARESSLRKNGAYE